MTARKGLRARVRIEVLDGAARCYAWEIAEPAAGFVDDEGGIHALRAGRDLSLERAMDHARSAVLDVLADRVADFDQGGDWDECPECGDPVRYEIATYPGGGSYRFECLSCGHSDSDSF